MVAAGLDGCGACARKLVLQKTCRYTPILLQVKSVQGVWNILPSPFFGALPVLLELGGKRSFCLFLHCRVIKCQVEESRTEISILEGKLQLKQQNHESEQKTQTDLLEKLL